jgi:hypothetical protein
MHDYDPFKFSPSETAEKFGVESIRHISSFFTTEYGMISVILVRLHEDDSVVSFILRNGIRPLGRKESRVALQEYRRLITGRYRLL